MRERGLFQRKREFVRARVFRPEQRPWPLGVEVSTIKSDPPGTYILWSGRSNGAGGSPIYSGWYAVEYGPPGQFHRASYSPEDFALIFEEVSPAPEPTR